MAADPIETDRLNVYEAWESDEAIETCRSVGPGPELMSDTMRDRVSRHQVSSSGPA